MPQPGQGAPVVAFIQQIGAPVPCGGWIKATISTTHAAAIGCVPNQRIRNDRRFDAMRASYALAHLPPPNGNVLYLVVADDAFGLIPKVDRRTANRVVDAGK